MDQPFTISLVRHARTTGNLQKLYVGWTDDELVENQYLPVLDGSLQQVYGSDLKRCRDTAACYYPNASYLAIPELRESNFGDYEMKSYEQLKNHANYRQWLTNVHQHHPPNGETLTELTERVLRGLLKIPQARNWHLVSHGGPMRVLLVQFAPEPTTFWDWQIGHDEQYILRFPSFQHFKEGRRCTSLSVVPITGKNPM